MDNDPDEISDQEQVLNELQLLTAMYSPSEVRYHDPQVLFYVENCIPIKDSVYLTVSLNENIDLDIRLPLGYPSKERLSAHCKISKKKATSLDRNAVQQWESQLNKDLSETYMKKGESAKQSGIASNDIFDMPNILGVIQWCNEKFESCPVPNQNKTALSSSNTESNSLIPSVEKEDECCRIWIFSHHIYNKNKRKFLVNTADELDLQGFSLPGKPGFICVEGEAQNCDDYWTRVRQQNWQKISMIERQIFPSANKIFDKSFEELQLDKSAFIRYLDEKNSSAIIKDYLGF